MESCLKENSPDFSCCRQNYLQFYGFSLGNSWIILDEMFTEVEIEVDSLYEEFYPNWLKFGKAINNWKMIMFMGRAGQTWH